MSQFRIYRGVSLIETLVAMFVLAIGLASLAALLPVGQSQVVKANLDDRKSVVGRAAWQEIQTRGMLDYKYWTFLKTTAYNAQWTDSVGTAPTTIKPPFAFAIDPLMVAVASEATPVVANRVRFFPYSVIPPSGPSGDPTIVPCMYRLSLADYSLLSAVPGGNVTSWPRALAEDVFYSHDNLNFVLPEPADEATASAAANKRFTQQTNQPSQIMEPYLATYNQIPNPLSSSTSTNPFPMKRSYGSINTKGTIGGVMSWLITLAPAPDAPNQCVISIVVYSQRTLVGDYLNERTFSSLGGVNKIPSGVAVDTTRLTVGLGEIVLKSTSPDDLMSLKSGSYLLLGGFQNKVPASPTDKKVVFSWYRIRNTGELTGTSAPYSRVITVQGRDWNPVSTSGTPLYKLDTTSVTAHYFPEVVAIYEKTLRLETSSLWSQ